MGKRILIIKAGYTLPETKTRAGDFEDWISTMMGRDIPVRVVNLLSGEGIPDLRHFSGAVITGSHDNVTDGLPWMHELVLWIRHSVSASVPILGICFGHQVLAHALGGIVDFHPRGLEAGTREIHLTGEGKTDRLLGILPSPFPAHVTHAQTVLQLPPGAIPLAFNSFEKHHAFRVGKHAWGVQFHPEYSAEVMMDYVKAEAGDLRRQNTDPEELMKQVRENTTGSLVMQRFAEICMVNR